MLLETVLNRCCQTQAIPVVALPAGLRLRQRGNLMVAINYEAYGLDLCHILEGASSFDYVIGGPDMPAAGVAVWRLK
jgi:beta-galactosidase